MALTLYAHQTVEQQIGKEVSTNEQLHRALINTPHDPDGLFGDGAHLMYSKAMLSLLLSTRFEVLLEGIWMCPLGMECLSWRAYSGLLT